MKKIIIIIFVFNISNVFSQEINTTDTLKKSTQFQINRNSVSLETNLIFSALNYERLLPLKNRTGIIVASGVYLLEGSLGFSLESDLLIGSTKHFFEIGLKSFMNQGKDDELFFKVYPELGYRFQGGKGFLFKTDVGLYPFHPDPAAVLPSFSFGYSF